MLSVSANLPLCLSSRYCLTSIFLTRAFNIIFPNHPSACVALKAYSEYLMALSQALMPLKSN